MKIKYIFPAIGVITKVLSSDYGLYQFIKYEPVSFLFIVISLYIIGSLADNWIKSVSEAQVKEN